MADFLITTAFVSAHKTTAASAPNLRRSSFVEFEEEYPRRPRTEEHSRSAAPASKPPRVDHLGLPVRPLGHKRIKYAKTYTIVVPSNRVRPRPCHP